ncbi:ferritin-like domain-containing protein [Flavobacterium sp.]|uniref:ferritin-like domain-containing protein n=1 Tax=Flavobacterium sp. TaxID=239 RepID=UPI0012065615|nr:ferritin-like domain-containing protein [Flavobacterium sp.]RZJ73933.1 MAG: ferritin-like domain-containing protein [Flavobacterium sp.]
MENKVTIKEVNPALASRRNFLKISGLTMAGAGLLMAGCNNDDDSGSNNNQNQLPGIRNGVFDLGGGDLGVLTYAYALEQLEADFYTKVVNATGFTGFTPEVQAVLTDLYNHEVIHREFFQAALSGALPAERVLPDLAFNYGTLNFSNQAAVLATAQALEDTGVAAYNGAGKVIVTPDYLVLAGKIVSVEARHASAIRSLINPGTASFAGNDVVDANGLDKATNPSGIISAVGDLGFITTPFTAQYLP